MVAVTALVLAALVGTLTVEGVRRHRADRQDTDWPRLARLLLGAVVAAAATCVLVWSVWRSPGSPASWPRGLLIVLLLGSAGATVGFAVAALLGFAAGRRFCSPVVLVVSLACTALGVILVVSFAIQEATGFAVPRSLFIAFGVGVIVCTALKPEWYWNHPKVTWVRDSFGESTATVLYYLMGLGLIGAGAFTRGVR